MKHTHRRLSPQAQTVLCLEFCGFVGASHADELLTSQTFGGNGLDLVASRAYDTACDEPSSENTAR